MWVARVGRTALARAQTASSVAHTPWLLNMFYLATQIVRDVGATRRDVHDLRATGQQHDAQPGLESVEDHRLLAQSTHAEADVLKVGISSST